MIALYLLAGLFALIALFFWCRDREKENQRRIDDCPHPAAQQKTLRINNILHPAAINYVIPGRRWLKKHCLACGWQRNLYAPTVQPYDEFVAEWKQEAIDREAEFRARTKEHEADVAHQERLRQLKREKGMQQHERSNG